MTKDTKDIPEYGDPETWGLKVGEYDEKYHSGLGDTWKIMRQTGDKEEQKELDEVELRSLKLKNIKFNKDVKEFRDVHGNKYNYNQSQKVNSEVRKEASKIIKDNNKLNRFMTAPNFDTYQSGPLHIRKSMETALDNVIKGRVTTVVTPKVNYNPTPVVTPRVDQAISEPNFDTPKDPDLDRGVGAIIGKYLGS
jgi:hypothetical protein